MAKAYLYVESHPSSPDRVDEYNTWYNDTHLAEIVALPGFVAAHRYEPVDGEGPYLAVYEIDDDDPESVVGTLGAAVGDGRVQMSDAIRLDPPPSMRLMRAVASESGSAV